MAESFKCSECEIATPHDHGWMHSPSGRSVEAIIYRSEDPNAEVRDPDTGEVIFPAKKAPFKLIEGGKP